MEVLVEVGAVVAGMAVGFAMARMALSVILGATFGRRH